MNEHPRADHAAFRPAQLCQFALKRRQVMGPLSVVQRQLHTSPQSAQPCVNNTQRDKSLAFTLSFAFALSLCPCLILCLCLILYLILCLILILS